MLSHLGVELVLGFLAQQAKFQKVVMVRTHVDHLVNLVKEKNEPKSKHLANDLIVFDRALLIDGDVSVRTQLDHYITIKLPLGIPLFSLWIYLLLTCKRRCSSLVWLKMSYLGWAINWQPCLTSSSFSTCMSSWISEYSRKLH